MYKSIYIVCIIIETGLSLFEFVIYTQKRRPCLAVFINSSGKVTNRVKHKESLALDDVLHCDCVDRSGKVIFTSLNQTYILVLKNIFVC